MNGNSLFTMIDAVVLVMAFYVFYITFQMQKTGQIKESPLMSKDINIKKCKDPAGYLSYIIPKQYVFGIATLLSGVVGLTEDLTGLLGPYVFLGAVAVLVGFYIWFGIKAKKAYAMFW